MKMKVGLNKNIKKKNNMKKIINLFIKIAIEKKVEKTSIKKLK